MKGFLSKRDSENLILVLGLNACHVASYVLSIQTPYVIRDRFTQCPKG